MDTDLVYTIHLEPAEEGGYVVTVPALPPVITQGETYAEAIAMAEDAIRTYLEYCIEQGKDVPIEAAPSAPLDAHVRIKAPAPL
jgi:predicted RNase H-like HicB family nuclease